MRRVRFLRAAQNEYLAALAWYASRSLDAADDFTEQIAAGIHSIRKTPDAWPLWRGHSEVRARVLRHFPYSILYIVRGEHVVIVAVAHQRRRPDYWLSRRLR